MELSKCIRCGKLYNRIRIAVCPTCEAEEEKDILAVSRYLKDHLNSSLDEVSDALNVYLEDISRWIEEKRLEVSVHVRTNSKCDACGAPVLAGRICKECQKRFLEDPLQELKVQPGGTPGAKSSPVYRSRREDGPLVGKYRRV